MKYRKYTVSYLTSSRYLALWFYLVLLFQSIQSSEASLSQTTVKTIVGSPPHLSLPLEMNMDDLDLFGLKVYNQNYYGEEVDHLPLMSNYPFKDKVAIAPMKYPNENEFHDADGDELIGFEANGNIKMEWFYTNSKNKLVSFVPKDNDTFCSLAKKNINAPFKVKLTTDSLLLVTKHGHPDYFVYPNDDVTTPPSKTYTIMDDVGICYAKPEIKPKESKANGISQWDRDNGFLPQSRNDPSKNFPTTGFYGARFQLILTNAQLAKDYEWSIKQGGELVQVNKDDKTQDVTVSFDMPDAKDPAKAWQYIMGSGDGYTVIVEGKNPQKNTTIQYSFTLVKWFTGWDENKIGEPGASVTTGPKVDESCSALAGGGKYRISYTNEVVNSNLQAAKAKYTREIGTLFSEWGDPSQKAYPNSWAANDKQDVRYKRIWLYDPDQQKYCDLHTYQAVYHCVAESGLKNGLCTAVAEDN